MREGLHKIVSVDETIVAISTPLGRSGIGVLRLSGRDAAAIAGRFFRPLAHAASLQDRTALIGTWHAPDGSVMDEVVVTLFRGPQSYTGEDVIEISAHGSPLMLARILETARSAGARLAVAGEFTLRAVANGKMDLIQAEAVREFIDAQTEQQAKTALRQLDGSVSNRIRPVKERLVDVIAHLEAGIDFAEDDVTVPDNAAVIGQIDPLIFSLDDLQHTFGYGRLLVEGLRIAILGKPNVGKSSLFNRLVSADRAIVTEIPGTTRDTLTETISMDGVPLRFVDTAGVRQTSDQVESLGVIRTFEALADADVALVVLDGSAVLDENDQQVLSKAKAIRHVLVVNKKDLPQGIETAGLDGGLIVRLSAKTGQGLEELRDTIRAFILEQKTDLSDDSILTSKRQSEAVARAAAVLKKVVEGLSARVPHEMVLLDLYEALSALDELTGEVVTDDILARIFSTFCVGK